jgi:hypothetical protein
VAGKFKDSDTNATNAIVMATALMMPFLMKARSFSSQAVWLRQGLRISTFILADAPLWRKTQFNA